MSDKHPTMNVTLKPSAGGKERVVDSFELSFHASLRDGIEGHEGATIDGEEVKRCGSIELRRPDGTTSRLTVMVTVNEMDRPVWSFHVPIGSSKSHSRIIVGRWCHPPQGVPLVDQWEETQQRMEDSGKRTRDYYVDCDLCGERFWNTDGDSRVILRADGKTVCIPQCRGKE